MGWGGLERERERERRGWERKGKKGIYRAQRRAEPYAPQHLPFVISDRFFVCVLRSACCVLRSACVETVNGEFVNL